MTILQLCAVINLKKEKDAIDNFSGPVIFWDFKIGGKSPKDRKRPFFKLVVVCLSCTLCGPNGFLLSGWYVSLRPNRQMCLYGIVHTGYRHTNQEIYKSPVCTSTRAYVMELSWIQEHTTVSMPARERAFLQNTEFLLFAARAYLLQKYPASVWNLALIIRTLRAQRMSKLRSKQAFKLKWDMVCKYASKE